MIFWTSIIVLCSYFCLIALLYIGAFKTRNLGNKKGSNQISVIIPFRNEGDRLEPLLASIKRSVGVENLVEFVFVDDHSEDFSKNLIEGTLSGVQGIQVIENVGIGKKAAINLGIASASHEVILTLDADVYFESDYLKSLTTLLLDSDCVILPVRLIAPKNNVVQHLDALEFKSLQLATFGMAGIGLPILANGANFLFKKTGFNMVNGYDGNEHVSSGDDLYLLHKFNDHPELNIKAIQHEKVMVSTLAESSLMTFIDQRIRWSSKTLAIQSVPNYLLSGIIVSVNFLVYVWLLMMVISFNRVNYVGFLMLKLALDYVLVLHRHKSYELGKSIFYIPLLSIAYPVYLCVLIPLSFFRKPIWKGRKTKKA